jgi:hypothetical protein
MNQQRAKDLLYRGRAVYADLNNGQRHRIIRFEPKYCYSISGRKINLTSVLDFN